MNKNLIIAALFFVGFLVSLYFVFAPEKEESMASEAEIHCPLGSSFSFARTVDDTITIVCHYGE